MNDSIDPFYRVSMYNNSLSSSIANNNVQKSENELWFEHFIITCFVGISYPGSNPTTYNSCHTVTDFCGVSLVAASKVRKMPYFRCTKGFDGRKFQASCHASLHCGCANEKNKEDLE